MLRSLRLQNFKSFADAQADFGPLTLLVGANASGKSNVLDAVRLLKGMGVLHLPLDWALQGTKMRGGWPGIRGGVHEVVRAGGNVFSIGSTWQVPSGERVEHSMECEVAPRLLVRKEQLREVGASQPLFEAQAQAPLEEDKDRAEPVMHLTVFPRGEPETVAFPKPSARWSALETIRSHTRITTPPHELSVQLQFALLAVQFLDMMPASMRRHVPREMKEIGEGGEFLSAVLWRLCQDADVKQGLIDWLAELCAPELEDIDFSETDDGDVMLRLIEKGGSRVSARSLSDGTLRFLGELVALRTAPEGSVLMMEELGNGLHPRRMHLLVEYLETMTQRRNIQVIATTHSPLVLQALGEHSRRDVVVLGRPFGAPGSIMRRLGDLPGFDAIVEQRGMDYLFTTGWLEQAL